MKHKSQGDVLTQAEYENVDAHLFDGQAKGDVPVAINATQISRLGVGTNGQVLTADSTETSGLKWGGGGPSQAAQAAIEAETNEDTYAPPDLIKHSPGVAKVWVKWEQTGAHGILASYNMTSVTDGGAVGDTDHLWATDFSSTEYVLVGATQATGIMGFRATSLVEGGVTTVNYTTDAASFDTNAAMIALFGDQ